MISAIEAYYAAGRGILLQDAANWSVHILYAALETGDNVWLSTFEQLDYNSTLQDFFMGLHKIGRASCRERV